MRAQIFGGLNLESSTGPVAPPSGRVGTLLHWLLLRPNETHGHDALVALLWPSEGEADPDAARDRLYVVVSRLRQFLDDEDPDGVALVTEADGYRLEAGPDALDRTAFVLLAGRALEESRPEIAIEALTHWRGDPYAGFPFSEEAATEQARLHEILHALQPLRGTETSAAVQSDHARTKFLRPTVPASSLVGRPKLLERMGPVGQAALVALVAPAGFGKSVLLSQWAEAQSGSVGWVMLEEADNDPIRFWSAIQQGLVAAGAIDGDALPEDAAPGSQRSFEALASAVTMAAEPIGLVLDDIHQVVNEDLHAQLGTLFGELAGHVTVAIGSRLPPRRSMQDEFDPDHVRVLRAADLRLEADDVVALARSSEAAVDPEQLFAVTEGWPIAVSYLARLAVSLPPAETASSVLQDYVTDEVQQMLPGEVHDFLLATAHLDRLSVDLCNAVRGRDDSRQHLDWLRERQLFVLEVSSDTGWYRYHHLFGSILRRLVEQDPAVDVAAGHRRAADWHAERGMLEEALGHAIAGGDDALVAELAPDVLWGNVARNEIYTCRRWLHRIDPDLLAANRGAHDLATIAAGGWLEPDRGEVWMESRRRHYGEGDLLASISSAHTAYLQGRARECVAINEHSLARIDAYFDDHPSRPGVREVTTGTLLASRMCGRILAGDLHHDDPEVHHMAELARAEMPVMALWVMGEWAFLAYAEGNRQLAADLVAEVAPHLASMDVMSTHLGAGRLLVAQALVESDREPGRATQQRIIRRLSPMVGLFRQLAWDVELIPVLLALHVAHVQAGEAAAAAAFLDDADVLLDLCPDAPLLVRARAELTTRMGDGSARRSTPTDIDLTDREHAVLEHLDAGLTYDAVAERLEMSRHTVAGHVKAIYRKLGVRSRHGAVRRYRDLVKDD